MAVKLVSIIIPIYNEEQFIINCINSVLDFVIPDGITTEILLIDGNSSDKTLEIIKEYFKDISSIKILTNPARTQSYGLNLGIRNARGNYILRLDAHAHYPKDYLQKLIETSERVDAQNIGGLVESLLPDNSYNASIVQALTTHKFGVGNSRFRIGAAGGYVDTVPYGFFRKDLFDKIGLFDERLVRAQDYEFNCRIRKNGGKIFLNPSIIVYYFNKSSVIEFLKKQFFLEAPYNAYMWYITPSTFTLRHSITFFFALGILFGPLLSFLYSPTIYVYFFFIVLYLSLAIFSSIQQAIRFNKFRHILFLPFCFFVYHFAHGIGILLGVIRLLSKKSPLHI